MASRVFYPPVVNSYEPAFIGGTVSHTFNFALSKFNGESDFTYIHVAINKQDTGKSVVNYKNSNGRPRGTGIILNVPVEQTEQSNIYSFTINANDLIDGVWKEGQIYKIQIRIDGNKGGYSEATGGTQEEYIKNNAHMFSEWSTVLVAKAIGEITVNMPLFDKDSIGFGIQKVSDEDTKALMLNTTTLDLVGDIQCSDSSEILYKYNFQLYQGLVNPATDDAESVKDALLEDSGDILASKFQNVNQFNYLFKTELLNDQEYTLNFVYTTNNGFIGYRYQQFYISVTEIEDIRCGIKTAEDFVFAGHTHSDNTVNDLTSVCDEEDEGRIGLKLDPEVDDPYNGNICIRRSSSRDNYTKQEDIKIIGVKGQRLSEIPPIYDYILDSGVYYKYGVQKLDKDGNRGTMSPAKIIKRMRNFNFSFLLGEGGQQLKLKFNNTMNSFKYQVVDTKIDPIGGKYPSITRNASIKYKTFPINGLISFNMDDNNLFFSRTKAYGKNKDDYDAYNTNNNITQYDYIYEREFREEVLKFLYDGKPKLFKSPTEGNIIVRLTDISCTPNQTTGRLIYDFSCTASEIAEATMENYIKYGFHTIGEIITDFSTYETKIGQLILNENNCFNNIFREIWNKYDSNGENQAGFTKTVKAVHHIRITIDDKPLKVIPKNGGIPVLGNNFQLGSDIFTILAPQRIYEIDERLIYYNPNTDFRLLKDADDSVEKIDATIDFLYELESKPYQEKEIASRKTNKRLGQLFGCYGPNTSLSEELKSKYYIEEKTTFSRVSDITMIEIESDYGAAFNITDEYDSGNPELHVINETGVLKLNKLANIRDIKYLGRYDFATKDIDDTINADILMNYECVILEGTYKEVT